MVRTQMVFLVTLVLIVVGVSPSAGAPTAYVVNLAEGVWVISTATNAVVATVPLAGCTTGVAIAPDGALAYVANNSSSTVSVIETATNHLVLAVPVGSSPQGVAITPDGAFAYVTHSAL